MLEWIITSCVLIVTVVLVRFLLKGRIGLHLQYGLWLLVLLRLLIPVNFISSPMSVMNAIPESAAFSQSPPVSQITTDIELPEPPLPDLPINPTTITMQTGNQPSQTLPEQTVPIVQKMPTNKPSLGHLLMLVWVAGMAVTAGVFLFANIRFAIQLKRTRKPEAPACPLPVYSTSIIHAPCLFGLFRPAIYLTDQALEDPGRQHILVHELTHFKHLDHIWGMLRCVCLVVHWYNPLVWLAAHLSRTDGELACDQTAIRQLGEDNRLEYGKTLIRLTCTEKDTGVLFTSATTMTGSKKALTHRVRLIARHPRTALYAVICLVLVAAIAVGCTFTGAKEPLANAPGETTLEETTQNKTSEQNQDNPWQEYFIGEQEYKPVEQVGQVPKEFEQIIASNEFNNIVACGDRLFRTVNYSQDRENRTATHTVQMLDRYARVLAQYSCTSRDAQTVTTLTATTDGGFLFVLGFEDFAYDQNTWASDFGQVSRVVKCDSTGKLQFETALEGVEGNGLRLCFEKNGCYYFFGTIQNPKTKTRGVYSSTDLYMTVLNQQGEVLKTKTIAGSDFDTLNNAELSNGNFILSVDSQSQDGDFAGSRSRGFPVDWVITVNDQLEIIEKKKQTGRNYFDDKIGEKDGNPVYIYDSLFRDFDAGSPNAFIDYGDFYLIVSANPTGIYENTPPMINATWYYWETVYSGYDQNGNLLFRKSVDRGHNYGQLVEEYWAQATED